MNRLFDMQSLCHERHFRLIRRAMNLVMKNMMTVSAGGSLKVCNLFLQTEWQMQDLHLSK